MATVTALADRVCSVTGLATSGTDRSKVLGYLNQAYESSVLEAGSYTSSFTVTLTAGTGDYTFGTSPLTATNVLEVRQVWVDDAALANRPLVRVPEHEIQSLRQAASTSSTPLYYAVRGDRQLLLYPAPVAGTTLTCVYVASPPTLVESGPGAGEESTPTAIPSPLQYDVITNKAVSLAMEFENRLEEAQLYDAKWAVGMERYLAYVARFGGPSLHSIGDVSYEGPRDQD